MISDENVFANPTESPPENDPWPAIMADPQLANARRKLSIHEIRLIIAHARRSADAPEIAAAKIRGLEIAREETHAIGMAYVAQKLSANASQTFAGRAHMASRCAAEILEAIDARIAELKAKTEP